MTYHIAVSKEAEAPVLEFDADFEEKIRRFLPSLRDQANANIEFSRSDPTRVLLVFDKDGEEWVFIGRTERKKNTLVILAAYRRQRWAQLSREEAIKIVEAGIGKRPDLPSGAEYVHRIKGAWKGLLPRDRRDS